MTPPTRSCIEKEKSGTDGSQVSSGLPFGVRFRRMEDFDLGRVRELRAVVRWPTDSSSFDLLRGVRDVRWSVAESREGALIGMVGAVSLGRVGVLCHLAVHDDYRGMGIGSRLTLWAVAHLRSRGAKTVRLYSTGPAEGLYHSLGFEPGAPRVTYRLEGAGNKNVPADRLELAGAYEVKDLEARDFTEVCGVDYWSHEADRVALIRKILESNSVKGLVARDISGRIKGYLIRNPNPSAARIGPFMASAPHVARLLLSKTLENHRELPLEATVTGPPEDGAHELFEQFGFSGRKGRVKMEFGESAGQSKGLESYATTPYLAT